METTYCYVSVADDRIRLRIRRCESDRGETLAEDELAYPPDAGALATVLRSHGCTMAVMVENNRLQRVKDVLKTLDDIEVAEFLVRMPDGSAPGWDEASEETVDDMVRDGWKPPPYTDPAEEILRFLTAEFGKARELAERAVAQMPAVDLSWRPDERGNSVSMLMRHLGGNLRSRFTDFLTTDGEKPDRDRDSEFRNDVTDQAAVMAKWRTGWECLERTLSDLKPHDLHKRREITIRGEPHTVLQALLRAVTHTNYHVGQIVDLARTRTAEWQTLSMPRPPGE